MIAISPKVATGIQAQINRARERALNPDPDSQDKPKLDEEKAKALYTSAMAKIAKKWQWTNGECLELASFKAGQISIYAIERDGLVNVHIKNTRGSSDPLTHLYSKPLTVQHLYPMDGWMMTNVSFEDWQKWGSEAKGKVRA